MYSEDFDSEFDNLEESIDYETYEIISAVQKAILFKKRTPDELIGVIGRKNHSIFKALEARNFTERRHVFFNCYPTYFGIEDFHVVNRKIITKKDVNFTKNSSVINSSKCNEDTVRVSPETDPRSNDDIKIKNLISKSQEGKQCALMNNYVSMYNSMAQTKMEKSQVINKCLEDAKRRIDKIWPDKLTPQQFEFICDSMLRFGQERKTNPRALCDGIYTIPRIDNKIKH